MNNEKTGETEESKLIALFMTNNNNLLWFVHKSYSLVGVLMSRKSCKCGHRAREHSYAPGTPFCENTLCFPCMECDCKNYEMAPKEAGF